MELKYKEELEMKYKNEIPIIISVKEFSEIYKIGINRAY